MKEDDCRILTRKELLQLGISSSQSKTDNKNFYPCGCDRCTGCRKCKGTSVNKFHYTYSEKPKS